MSVFSLWKDLVYAIGPEGALIAGYILRILQSLVDDKVLEALKKRIDRDPRELQSKLFGICDDILVLRGRSKWVRKDDPDEVYGGSSEVPVYDWIGLATTAEFVKGLENFTSAEEDVSVDIHRNILSIGGEGINPFVKEVFNIHFPSIQFHFVNYDQIPKKYQPLSRCAAYRVYKDRSSGLIYWKPGRRSIRVLTDKSDPLRPPMGPVYAEDGRIIEDLLLVTTLPNKSGKRITLITPGHGSGSRLSNVLCDYHVLKEISRAIRGKSPFFQAIFRVPANVTQEEESYEEPVLDEVRPLYI